MKHKQKLVYFLLVLSLIAGSFLVSGCAETTKEDIDEIESKVIVLNDIIGIEWQWSETVQTEPDIQTVVPDPEKYTIAFSEDNTYSIKADCNVGSGSYTLEENKITINPGPMTLVYCGDESFDNKYLAFLGNVKSIAIENDQLVLYLDENGDKMLFTKGQN